MEFKRSKDLPAVAQMITANPEVRTLQLQSGDEFLILACDGIWDVLTNQEVSLMKPETKVENFQQDNVF